MEGTFLGILIATFVGVSVLSLYVLVKLFAGQQ